MRSASWPTKGSCARGRISGGVPRESADALGARILRLLSERYPCTVRDIVVALRVREDSVRREVGKLAAAGRVVTEDLDGATYVALSGLRKGAPARPPDRDDPAFG